MWGLERVQASLEPQPSSPQLPEETGGGLGVGGGCSHPACTLISSHSLPATGYFLLPRGTCHPLVNYHRLRASIIDGVVFL